MGKLTYLGKEQDWDIELERIEHFNVGFDITVCLKPNREGEPKRITIRHNCSEIHHRFNEGDISPVRTAFESKHHLTGCWFDVDDIEWIIVVEATELHFSHVNDGEDISKYE